jgi:hypothetical protein
VLGKWATKIRRSCRITVSGLGNSDRQVPVVSELVEHAPLDEIFSTRTRPVLVPVQKYNSGPWAVAFWLLQEVFHLLDRLVRVGDRESLGLGDFMPRTGNHSDKHQQYQSQ